MTDKRYAVTKATPRRTSAPRRHTIGRKVKAALDAMVWLGRTRDQAALSAGLQDNSLYKALRRPDVKAYYLAECEVLRVSGRAQRIHRLEALATQDENKQAAVNAIRALEQMGDDLPLHGHQVIQPGMTVVIVNSPPTPARPPQPAEASVIEHGEPSMRDVTPAQPDDPTVFRHPFSRRWPNR